MMHDALPAGDTPAAACCVFRPQAGTERAVPTRLIRRDQAKALAAQGGVGASTDMDVDEPAASSAAPRGRHAAAAAAAAAGPVDGYEFADPVDILSQLKGPFWEALEVSAGASPMCLPHPASLASMC